MRPGAGTRDLVPRGECRAGAWGRSGVGSRGTRSWGKGGAAGPPLGAGGHERCPAD